jgi:hypothetical protein
VHELLPGQCAICGNPGTTSKPQTKPNPARNLSADGSRLFAAEKALARAKNQPKAQRKLLAQKVHFHAKAVTPAERKLVQRLLQKEQREQQRQRDARRKENQLMGTTYSPTIPQNVGRGKRQR